MISRRPTDRPLTAPVESAKQLVASQEPYPRLRNRNINISVCSRLMARALASPVQSPAAELTHMRLPRQVQTVAIIALLLSIVIACGSCDRAEARARSTAVLAPVIWMVPVGPDRPMYEQLLARFRELRPDIPLQPMWVSGSQYQTKLKTLIAAGQSPDIFWSSDVWVAYELPFLADLTDLVQRDAKELELDDFYPELL